VLAAVTASGWDRWSLGPPVNHLSSAGHRPHLEA
jgi:hypothetical protein